MSNKYTYVNRLVVISYSNNIYFFNLLLNIKRDKKKLFLKIVNSDNRKIKVKFLGGIKRLICCATIYFLD